MTRSPQERPFLRVGLTGGIASGKSEVDRMLADLGAHVIDADQVVHDLLRADPETIQAIGAAFGAGVLAEDGSVDRAALGHLVFADTHLREVLNKILHPRVRVIIEERMEKVRREGHEPVVVVDAALLVESGVYKIFDKLVVVTSSTDSQIERLGRRDGLSREQALARIAAQWPTEAKLAVAHYRIDNDGSLDSTRRQVRELWDRLLADARDNVMNAPDTPAAPGEAPGR